MEFGLLVDAVCGKDTDNNVIYRSKIKPIQIFISSSRGLALQAAAAILELSATTTVS